VEWCNLAQEREKLSFDLARQLARDLSFGLSRKEERTVQHTSFARGVEVFAAADPVFSRLASDWDQDPWKLGTPNGTIDLLTGCLGVALQSDQITKSTAVAPADRGDCALWLKFLKEATDGFHELIRFLQQSCGYALTGVTKEHALVFVYGSGGNGKSVFLNVLTSILKDYAETASTDTFTASKSDKHPTDIAKLRGARLVTASETEEGKAWAEARIKEMTAGGDISARFRTFFGHSEQENDDTP
jgi:putative DNA primase/helicase